MCVCGGGSLVSNVLDVDLFDELGFVNKVDENCYNCCVCLDNCSDK